MWREGQHLYQDIDIFVKMWIGSNLQSVPSCKGSEGLRKIIRARKARCVTDYRDNSNVPLQCEHNLFADRIIRFVNETNTFGIQK